MAYKEQPKRLNWAALAQTLSVMFGWFPLLNLHRLSWANQTFFLALLSIVIVTSLTEGNDEFM